MGDTKNTGTSTGTETKTETNTKTETGGRTGYVERGHKNNTGNDSQSRQMDKLDKERD